MKRLYAHASAAGTFHICRVGRQYLALFESRLIDTFPTAERAALMLAACRQLSLPNGFSFDELLIPADLRQWEAVE